MAEYLSVSRVRTLIPATEGCLPPALKPHSMTLLYNNNNHRDQDNSCKQQRLFLCETVANLDSLSFHSTCFWKNLVEWGSTCFMLAASTDRNKILTMRLLKVNKAGMTPDTKTTEQWTQSNPVLWISPCGNCRPDASVKNKAKWKVFKNFKYVSKKL